MLCTNAGYQSALLFFYLAKSLEHLEMFEVIYVLRVRR